MLRQRNNFTRVSTIHLSVGGPRQPTIGRPEQRELKSGDEELYFLTCFPGARLRHLPSVRAFSLGPTTI